ncbi:hypothetical protein [Mesorhizobium sp. ANAO-SY3R2]|uniref:hypothetical protein n=1 Tax=Mesorhizobium sp. ANAO-SY3R2 TaxID=3166644 RepID=UPI00367084D4
MNAQDIVNTVSTQLKLDPATAEKAVGTIFSVLEHESGGVASAGLFTRIPGADDLAHSYDVMAGAGSGGGHDGSLGSLLGASLGEKTGAIVNGITQLRSLGLDMAQIEQAGETLMREAQDAAGPQTVSGLVDAVPALKGHFGL